MKFSAVISVYKHDDESQFNAAIQSLLKQSVVPDEIIVVVDGKVGQPLHDLLTELESAPLVRLLRLPENKGRGVARQTAIEASSHPFIAMMDADDISVPNRFELQVEAMEQQDLDIVGGYVEEFETTPGDLGLVRKVPELHEDILKYGKWRQPMNHVTIFFKKEIYIQAGGYRDFRILEDFDFFYRLMNADVKFGNVPEVLVYARFSDKHYSRRKGLEYFKEEYQVLNDVYKSGSISFFQFLANCCIRFIARMSPMFVLKKLYKQILRY